ncbi:unnamed protein product [Lupinus luteus]|uniref:Hexosyltransferase n=1 Tax=Lupinus luteus TaxID=3873 RepID=A0AAV1W2Z4_LUPLU
MEETKAYTSKDRKAITTNLKRKIMIALIKKGRVSHFSLQVLATAILLSSSSAIILSSSSSARTEGRRNHYKVAADAEEGRRRRRPSTPKKLREGFVAQQQFAILLTTSIERLGFDRLHRGWHVLGIAYVPALKLTEIENAAVIHYNGNYMLWLNVP